MNEKTQAKVMAKKETFASDEVNDKLIDFLEALGEMVGEKVVAAIVFEPETVNPDGMPVGLISACNLKRAVEMHLRAATNLIADVNGEIPTVQ